VIFRTFSDFRPCATYGLMYLAVGMFPSCDMSSGGKLAPSNHAVNRFFAANEALAIACAAPAGPAACTFPSGLARVKGRLDVHMKIFHATPMHAQTRKNTGLRGRQASRDGEFGACTRCASHPACGAARGHRLRLNDGQIRQQKIYARCSGFLRRQGRFRTLRAVVTPRARSVPRSRRDRAARPILPDRRASPRTTSRHRTHPR